MSLFSSMRHCTGVVKGNNNTCRYRLCYSTRDINIPHNILYLICVCVNACQNNHSILMLLLLRILLIVIPRTILFHGLKDSQTGKKQRKKEKGWYTRHRGGKRLSRNRPPHDKCHFRFYPLDEHIFPLLLIIQAHCYQNCNADK